MLQEEAVTAISRAIRRARVGLKNPNRPIASFIFSGPTGEPWACTDLEALPQWESCSSRRGVGLLAGVLGCCSQLVAETQRQLGAASFAVGTASHGLHWSGPRCSPVIAWTLVLITRRCG